MEVRPVAETEPESFANCWDTNHNNLEQFLGPAAVTDELAAAILDVAIRSYRALECRDLARVDVRLDGMGVPNFLEINPLPGLSTVSLFPVTAMASGLSFEELIDKILEVAAIRTNGEARKAVQAQNQQVIAGQRHRTVPLRR